MKTWLKRGAWTIAILFGLLVMGMLAACDHRRDPADQCVHPFMQAPYCEGGTHAPGARRH